MELTLGQISSLATTFLQGRLDLSVSDMSLYANLAQKQMSVQVEHRALEGLAISSTTSGENRIALPTDFDYPINLSHLSDSPWWWSGKDLRATNPAMMDSWGTAPGIPLGYTIYSDWIELYPSPDSAYSLQFRYGAKVRTMVDSADTPTLDDRYHYALACKTAELASAARNDTEQEALNRARYLDAMSSTPSDRAYQQRPLPGMSATIGYRGMGRRW